MTGTLLGQSCRLPRFLQQSPTLPWQFCIIGQLVPSLHCMISTCPVVVCKKAHESPGNAGGNGGGGLGSAGGGGLGGMLGGGGDGGGIGGGDGGACLVWIFTYE